jgi:leader peptidase (prepilin peptidase)/N-methyltransferase
MPIAWWGLLGLFAAALINRAADCWFSPARPACGLTRHPARQAALWVGVPVLFALLAGSDMAQAQVATACLFAAILILLAVIDLEQRRLPDVIVLPALAVALVVRPGGDLGTTVAGAGAALALFLLLYALGRRLYGPGALGMGDVKLAALIGAVVGLERLALALPLGILLAGGAALVLLLSGRASRSDSLPYGHFMALAAVVVMVV